MNYLIMALRFIHIFAGIFWVGSAFVMTFFIKPTMDATAAAGQKFLGHLMNNMKLSNRIASAAGLSILAGFALFWIDSQGFTSAWMSSGAGSGFSIGAAFALLGFAYGILVGRTTKAMAQLGAQFQGKPSSDQMTQMQALSKKLATFSTISTAGLVIAVLFISIARYFVF